MFSSLDDGTPLQMPATFVPNVSNEFREVLRSRSSGIPQIFIEKITLAEVSFQRYDVNETALTIPGGAVTIPEHRFFCQDADGADYDFPTTRDRPRDIVWPTENIDAGETRRDSSFPFIRGVPGPDNVELGPATTMTGIRIEVEEVQVAPAVVKVPENETTRLFVHPAQFSHFIFPSYEQNGEEQLVGTATIPGFGDTSELDGAWQIDDVPGYRLVSAERLEDPLAFRITLARKHPFGERVVPDG